MSQPRPSFPASRDRWLVSYADLMTILLACFATTYAASRGAEATAPAPTAIVAPVAPVAAIAPASLDVADLTTPDPTAPDSTAATVPSAAMPSLRDIVAPLVAASTSHIALMADARGVVVSLPESATFATGSAELAAPARAFLRDLANTLRPTGATLRIEGHTDDVPVAGGKYGSNWELSTARASAVVAFLIADAAFAPERLSAAGYGEFHPRVANDSPEHRAANRRVDVVLIEAGSPAP